MIVQILGTKGEIEPSLPKHRYKSGILIDGVLLIDLGEKAFLKYKPKWILISHFHPDHAYFMRRGHTEEIPKNIPIFAPEKPKAGIKLLKRKKKIGPYTIIPIPTHHSNTVKSQGYLIKKGKKSILYTADMVWIDKKYHHLFDKVDLVITEGSFMRKGGMIRKDPKTGVLYGHQGVPNLIRIFSQHTNKIVITHFGNWFFDSPQASRRKLKGLGEDHNVEVLPAKDGMKCIV